jgi:hypothetical protein
MDVNVISVRSVTGTSLIAKLVTVMDTRKLVIQRPASVINVKTLQPDTIAIVVLKDIMEIRHSAVILAADRVAVPIQSLQDIRTRVNALWFQAATTWFATVNQDMPALSAMLVMTITSEIPTNLAAHVRNVTATTTSMLVDQEIAMQRMENVFSACTIRMVTTANIAEMDSMAML